MAARLADHHHMTTTGNAETEEVLQVPEVQTSIRIYPAMGAMMVGGDERNGPGRIGVREVANEKIDGTTGTAGHAVAAGHQCHRAIGICTDDRIGLRQTTRT